MRNVPVPLSNVLTRSRLKTSLTIKSTAAIIAALISSTALAGATPTPLPGGANQVKAQSGVLGKTVWNGAVRLTLSEFRDATVSTNRLST